MLPNTILCAGEKFERIACGSIGRQRGGTIGREEHSPDSATPHLWDINLRMGIVHGQIPSPENPGSSVAVRIKYNHHRSVRGNYLLMRCLTAS